MNLNLDHHLVAAKPGQSLLDLIRQEGLDSEKLSARPIAAKIAGEVFTLNYVPLRQKDLDSERPSMRRAMAASGGEVRLLSCSDPAGRECYIRTAQFVVFLALRQLWPNARAKMHCTLGASVFIQVTGADDFSVSLLKQRIRELTEQDIPLIRRRVSKEEAIDHYRRDGQTDKARLLSWRPWEFFDEYAYQDFADYYYGEMAPSTGYLQVWDVVSADGGFLFLYPDEQNPDRLAPIPSMPKFLSVFHEGERWCSLMECETVADLNDLTVSGKLRELIRVNEALHEKGYSQVAVLICQRGAKSVMLACPSSSG